LVDWQNGNIFPYWQNMCGQGISFSFIFFKICVDHSRTLFFKEGMLGAKFYFLLIFQRK